MGTRTSSAADQFIGLVPEGVELDSLRDLVSDDLTETGSLADLVEATHRTTLNLGEPHSQHFHTRSVLVALAARAAGATKVDSELQYASELLHLALRVHDLALGHEGRRGRIARGLLHRSTNWLGANHLVLRALELTRHRDQGVVEELVDTLKQFAHGQALCRELQGGRKPDRSDWLDHADAHTGALFVFCCRAGGYLAEADRSLVASLGRYGRHMGRVWHIAEDLSALRSDDPQFLLRALLGRPALPVICAQERDPSIGDAWMQLVTDPDPEASMPLVQRVLAIGGHNTASKVMLQESWQACTMARKLPPSPYRDALISLVEGMTRAAIHPEEKLHR